MQWVSSKGKYCGPLSGAGNRGQVELGEKLSLRLLPAGLQVHVLCLGQPGAIGMESGWKGDGKESHR